LWSRKSTRPIWRLCRQPFSFYHDFIARYWAGGPSEASAAPIHRLCTLARKMGAQSFLIDDGLGRADIEEEIAHLEALAETEGEVKAITVTLLSRPRRRDRDVSKVPTEAVIGQFSIVTFPGCEGPKSYIYEALFRLPCRGRTNEPLLNNHVPISGDLQISLRGHPHRFRGSYFCQQNGISSICAHSAVRTLVRTLKNQHVATCELNSFWHYNPDTRTISTRKVEQALIKYGFRPVPYDLNEITQTVSDYAPDNIWALLTLLADSGSPSLLTLSEGDPADHVVPILGHTFNSDEWHPIGTILHKAGEETSASSHLWIDHLVMHDDMLGPYFCLSRAGLIAGRNKKQLTPQLVIAMLPDQVEVSPVQAEEFARQIMPRLLGMLENRLPGEGEWWDHLLGQRERRVFRTTLIGRDEYLTSLGYHRKRKQCQLSDADRITARKLAGSLPERMWMCEVSVPNLFLANRSKLGELLIDAKEFPDDKNLLIHSLLGFRLPSLIGWSAKSEEGAYRLSGTAWGSDGHSPIHAPLHHANRW
jgi:hypothetical protein